MKKKKSPIDLLIDKLKIELEFVERHGVLNRGITYYDGRVDSMWLAIDYAKGIKTEAEKEVNNDPK